jgi:hypothetical protein
MKPRFAVVALLDQSTFAFKTGRARISFDAAHPDERRQDEKDEDVERRQNEKEEKRRKTQDEKN